MSNECRYLLDSPYNLCRDPLFAKSNVSATSAAAYRKAVDGRLWSGSSWTAENSDFQQALIFDLGDIKNVTGIATQVNNAGLKSLIRLHAILLPMMNAKHSYQKFRHR